MSFVTSLKQSDTIGSLASGLCLIHCLATPFLFVAYTGAAGHEHGHGHGHGSPAWWGVIDLVFLAVSLLAVVWSARNSSRNWMKGLLFLAWAGLALIILNEKMGWFHIPEEAIYVPALSLVGLHLYNRRYCQCSDEEGCAPDNL